MARCPFSAEEILASRRALLLGAAGLAGSAVCPASAETLGLPPTHDHTLSNDSLTADHSHDNAPHDFDNDGTREAQPFYGEHQSGIVNPQPAAAIVAAFDVLASSRADLQRLFETLTDRIAFLTKGGLIATANPQMPAPDNGLLGPDVLPRQPDRDGRRRRVAVRRSLRPRAAQADAPRRDGPVPQRRAAGRALPRRPGSPVLRQHGRDQPPRLARDRPRDAGPALGSLDDERFSCRRTR